LFVDLRLLDERGERLVGHRLELVERQRGLVAEAQEQDGLSPARCSS
jgi:hypothetical protein